MYTVAVKALMSKELKRFIRVPLQTIATPLVTTVLYFAVFSTSIGSRIGSVQGLGYGEFIMPGLLMMNLVTTAFMGIASGIMLTKFMNTMTDILVSPMSYIEIILGFVASSTIRTLATGLVLYVTALFFIPFRVDHPIFLIIFCTLVCLVFSLIGLVVGIWADDFEKLSIIPTFILTPLSFLGGVFYSTAMLPKLAQMIAVYNPLLYMINGMRYGFYSISDVNPWFALSVLLVLTLGMSWFTAHLFKIGYKLRN
jgi:ABC-2 type transport system permease protein